MSQYKPTFEDRLARLHLTSAITPRCAKKRTSAPRTTVEKELAWLERQPTGLYKAMIEASTLSTLLLFGFVA